MTFLLGQFENNADSVATQSSSVQAFTRTAMSTNEPNMMNPFILEALLSMETELTGATLLVYALEPEVDIRTNRKMPSRTKKTNEPSWCQKLVRISMDVDF